jgi:ribonuclease Z
MGLLGRETDLHLYASPPLEGILDQILKAADTKLPFTLHFHPLVEEGLIVDDEKFSIECFSVNHRIECFGFIFREKKKPKKIDKEKITNYSITPAAFEKLKMGEDVETITGEEIKNEWVTIEATPPHSYAFCADTKYKEEIAEKVKNVSLLYHETTYLKDLEERALNRFHSTTNQAANIALKANAKRLLIGHFSSKYEKLDQFLDEASAVFPATELAIEGCTYRIIP